MKKTSIVIAVVLLLSLSASMSASASSVLRASLYLSNYTASATADGGGNVSIWFEVTATQVSDYVGVTTIQIEQKNGSNWVPVKTYSSSTTAGLMGTNRLFYGSTITYGGTSGQQYRASVTVYAERSGGFDSRVITTNTVTA